MSWVRRGLKIICIILLLTASSSLKSYCQPYPCTDTFGCPDGCKFDRITCWDPDDAVPLDNEIWFLLIVGSGIGLYKINLLKRLQTEK